MSRLPFNLIPLSDERIKFHKRWVRERLLDLELSKGLEVGPELMVEVLPDEEAPYTPHDIDVRVGQIRLLDDELCQKGDLLRYVAVLSEDEDVGTVLCVPFSRYSEPATKDEWRTPYESSPLKVLQLWNVHEVPLSCLARHSWTILSMEDEVLTDLRTIYASVVSGTWLPVNLRNQTGTPIFRPDDIRLKYQSQDWQAFGKLDERFGTHMETIEKFRHPEQDIFADLRNCRVEERLAAAGHTVRRPVRINYSGNQLWDGIAVQIDSYPDGDEYEIRWAIEGSPRDLAPGLPVLVCLGSDKSWQTITKAQGELIVLRIKDATVWRTLEDIHSDVRILVNAN